MSSNGLAQYMWTRVTLQSTTDIAMQYNNEEKLSQVEYKISRFYCSDILWTLGLFS